VAQSRPRRDKHGTAGAAGGVGSHVATGPYLTGVPCRRSVPTCASDGSTAIKATRAATHAKPFVCVWWCDSNGCRGSWVTAEFSVCTSAAGGPRGVAPPLCVEVRRSGDGGLHLIHAATTPPSVCRAGRTQRVRHQRSEPSRPTRRWKSHPTVSGPAADTWVRYTRTGHCCDTCHPVYTPVNRHFLRITHVDFTLVCFCWLAVTP
jgi:hypothetical protein